MQGYMQDDTATESIQFRLNQP